MSIFAVRSYSQHYLNKAASYLLFAEFVASLDDEDGSVQALVWDKIMECKAVLTQKVSLLLQFLINVIPEEIPLLAIGIRWRVSYYAHYRVCVEFYPKYFHVLKSVLMYCSW